MSTPLDQETLVVRAYARLKSLHDNVPSTATQTAHRQMVEDFNRALADLKSAGYDLSAFELRNNELERDFSGTLTARSDVLRSRVDAALIYFRIDQDPEDEGPVRARIGFEAPKPPESHPN
jgi:hypothetical protein